MKTVHLIGNAHLDPVWLWTKAEGVDAVLATARSACDRLEECPAFIFTCSGMWFHQVIERHDPALFERVKAHVCAGRWQLVGGMVIQPDCNLPSSASFERQLAVGQEYYRNAFGRATTVGYNVDSFGHGAYLPRFLRQAGIDCYVFMRPGAHEKKLPASPFRWKSPDGQEVVACRIASAGYCTAAEDLRRHVEAALDEAGDKTDQAMCFYGVGDHGGGPTKAQLEWVLAHADFAPGVKLVLSHPRAYFDAVAERVEQLPVVADELQHHAVGCYSVERRIKTAMRRAESKLVQAEQTVQVLGGTGFQPVRTGGTGFQPVRHSSGGSERSSADAAVPDFGELSRAAAARQDSCSCEDVEHVLEHCWQRLLFNQFHDIFAGTCIDLAGEICAGEVMGIAARAEDVITLLTRRAFRNKAEPGRHKIVVFNPSDEAFDGYLTHEPWLQWGPLAGKVIVDENGQVIPHQVVEPRAKMKGLSGVLFRAGVPARSFRLLQLVDIGSTGVPPVALGDTGGTPVLPKNDDAIRVGDWTISLDVHEDDSDTWSHSCVNRFAGAKLGSFAWQGRWEQVEAGPLRWAQRRQATFGDSRLWCRLSATADEPLARMHLSIVWAEARRLLRLRAVGPGKIQSRIDLVSGGPLERPADGLEYPLCGGLAVQADSALAIAAPEVFSVCVEGGDVPDVSPLRSRGGSPDPPREGAAAQASRRAAVSVALLLLRSPYQAHHDPMPAELRPDHAVADQGRHEFDLVFLVGAPTSPERLARLARQMQAPPIMWDLLG